MRNSLSSVGEINMFQRRDWIREVKTECPECGPVVMTDDGYERRCPICSFTCAGHVVEAELNEGYFEALRDGHIR